MYHDRKNIKARRVDLHMVGDRVVVLPSPATLREESALLFGLPLINSERKTIAEHLVAYAAIGRRTVVNFVNAHCVNMMGHDQAYRRALADSDLLLPDGAGMRLAAKLAGVAIGDNLNGTDLFPDICAQAAQAGVSLYLLGGAPGMAAAAAAAMQARYPDLRIAGTMHGYFRTEDGPDIATTINRSGAGMVFVGFGVPLQELWIERFRDRLTAPVLLGVGGLFDYYSGRIARAPVSIQKIGCEWIWRLWREPRRLAGRYLIGNATFLARAALHALVARGIPARIDSWAKRTMDVAGSLAALLILAPLMLAVSCAIKAEDGGSVLFRQTRIGRDGRPFTMLKFRSMAMNAEHRRASLLHESERDATCFKMRRDPRRTRTGAVIRRFSLDELPQLINVLRGDMSLVGPWPALPQEVIGYSDEQWRRLAGTPGITGSWQVSGRAHIPFQQQVAMDIDYLRNRSFLKDILLLLRTIPAVIGGHGAY